LKNFNRTVPVYERFKLAFSKGDSPVGMRTSCRSATRSANFRFRYCLAVDGVCLEPISQLREELFRPLGVGVFATERCCSRNAAFELQVRCAPMAVAERVLSFRSAEVLFDGFLIGRRISVPVVASTCSVRWN
jgi:hypothetical protein